MVYSLLLLLGFWWKELGGPCSAGVPQIPVSVQAGVGSQTRFRPGFVPRKMCHLAVLILHTCQDCPSIICVYIYIYLIQALLQIKMRWA